MKNEILYFLGILSFLLGGCSVQQEEERDVFSWDNATVYFVYVDRFFNGNINNDENYGRKNDYGSSLKNVATFHGGDIAGLTQKLEEGYFRDLGITALWITGVYEQIHGWVGGGDANDFPHYAYHGYYPMDFTSMDRNFGTIEEFRTFVDRAHEQGIRVIMDAGINHPGYQTLLDAVQYDFGGVDLTEAEAVEHIGGLTNSKEEKQHYQIYRYLQHFDSAKSASWNQWWGYDWVRTPEEVDKDLLTESIFGLADFRTESREKVGLPPLLLNKWSMEQGEDFMPWVNPSALKYRQNADYSQSDYVIKWLAAWVEEFGIDGFRCDVVENVDDFRWLQLKEECDLALNRWRLKNASKEASQWTEDFWMTGDIWDADIRYYSNYANLGFSSIVNFTFPKDGNLDAIGQLWQYYADSLNTNPNWSTLSFLNNTYKRDTDFSKIEEAAVALLLAPGAVQIFYGDEVTRPEMKTAATDPTHGYRSDFVWRQNEDVLAHWQKLGKFRKKHLAVGAGKQEMIAPNTYRRTYQKRTISDTVLIKIKCEEVEIMEVAEAFADGTLLRNAYTGELVEVKDGVARFNTKNEILLIERAAAH
ncbi:alpha-amylase family glycosyl hydrolase [Algivirga pacifica]|uniref:Glycosyl hydrolase family 13 catalytic domain-containing protein n=1 Tax=Algivirga pacifica TaxID=1162670 RepID=A0ABP9DNA0_9BACT